MLTWGTGGRALTQSETLRRVVIIMSTYEELSLIISVALLIVAILNYTHKKESCEQDSPPVAGAQSAFFHSDAVRSTRSVFLIGNAVSY